MSRIYFHTPSGDAEVRGSEKAWLSHVAAGPATYAWDLDRTGDHKRAYALVEMMDEPGRGDYLQGYMRDAKEEDERYRLACDRHNAAFDAKPGMSRLVGHPSFNPEPARRFIQALQLTLRVDGFPIRVGEHPAHTKDIELNTALTAGSDVVALAAKIDGWCECHAFVEGADRDWLAGLIVQGLDDGIFRRGIWYLHADGSRDQWSPQGWEELVPWLRARVDEPVVMSYSVGDQFPARGFAVGWEPPVLPFDWRPSWADGEEGIAEWEAVDESDKDRYRKEHQQEAWYELSAEDQWGYAMRGLRERQPWARIAPDTLREVTFGKPVTVYDLFAPDRDERFARAFTSEYE